MSGRGNPSARQEFGRHPLAYSIKLALTGVGTAALMTGAPFPALAQTKAATQLEEVVVTSRRREETLQDTPLAVTALGDQTLENLQITDMRDINGVTPNAVISSVPGFNAAAIGFRGTSTGDIILTFDPAVGVVIDDFVIAHVQTQLLDLYDVERIEMLRGPQGTLFGKNTIGGVINVTTKRPVLDAYEGKANLRIGNFGTREFRGVFNAPIVEDQLATRTSILYQNSDGFYENTKGGGGDLGGQDVLSIRQRLLWTPRETTRILFGYEYLRDRSDAPPSVNETPAGFAFAAFGFPGIQVTGGDPFDTGMTLCDGDIDDPDCVGVINGHQVTVHGIQMNAEQDFDIGTATLVTGYRWQESILPSDFSGEPARLFESTRDDIRRQLMIEGRFASALSGPLNFVVGGQYWSNNLDYESSSFLSFLRFLGDPTATSDPNLGAAEQYVDSWALFGEADYELVENRLSLIFGARFTNENKRFIRQPQVRRSGVIAGLQPTFRQEESFDAITIRSGLRMQFNDNVSGYLTYSQGFKSGGFNSQAMTAFSAQPFDEETADSYELGIRSELFDRRLQVNATAFYVEYEDLQRESVLPFIDPITGLPGQETVTTNAGGAEVWGIEIETIAVPLEGLTLQANIGWQEAEYTEFETDIDADGINDDASFLDLTRTPEWTAFASATYELPTTVGTFTSNLNINYQSESQFSVLNADNTQIEERTLLNASLKWTHPNGKYSVAGFGRNITDETYRVSGNSVAGLWNFTQYGMPAHYGVELNVEFF